MNRTERTQIYKGHTLAKYTAQKLTKQNSNGQAIQNPAKWLTQLKTSMDKATKPNSMQVNSKTQPKVKIKTLHTESGK